MIDAFVYIQIRNMAEKVPSFKTSGTLWFTDLTTADTIYILPLLTAIIFIIMVEEGMEGNPVAGTMKKFSRIIAFLSIPILMGIEKVTITLPPSLDSLMLIISNDFFWACIVLLPAHFQPVYSWVWIRQVPSPLSFPQTLRRPDVRKLLNLPDAVTSSSTGQPKDQSVIGHEDPPMVNK
ncbi:unnamed protein product [Brassica oleracea]